VLRAFLTGQTPTLNRYTRSPHAVTTRDARETNRQNRAAKCATAVSCVVQRSRLQARYWSSTAVDSESRSMLARHTLGVAGVRLRIVDLTDLSQRGLMRRSIQSAPVDQEGAKAIRNWRDAEICPRPSRAGETAGRRHQPFPKTTDFRTGRLVAGACNAL
jgi:hypothetical protein